MIKEAPHRSAMYVEASDMTCLHFRSGRLQVDWAYRHAIPPHGLLLNEQVPWEVFSSHALMPDLNNMRGRSTAAVLSARAPAGKSNVVGDFATRHRCTARTCRSTGDNHEPLSAFNARMLALMWKKQVMMRTSGSEYMSGNETGCPAGKGSNLPTNPATWLESLLSTVSFLM